MKAYLIDPKAGTITTVDVARDESGSILDAMRALLECELVDVARDIIPGHDVWIDDEGALRDEPAGLFWSLSLNEPIAGRGLALTCDDEGDCQDATCTAADVAERVAILSELSPGLVFLTRFDAIEEPAAA